MQMTDCKKYLLRFGFILSIVLPILFFIQGTEAVKIVTYKICLVATAVGLAELIWVVFFRIVYGKSEGLSVDERKSVMLFRGMLYASIVLALTLGL